jgi:DNA ligase (NAD+)
MDEILMLATDIMKYRDAYWNGEPLISDTEYDNLIKKLQRLDPSNRLLNDIEHGVIKSGNGKIKHDVPMLSLNKVYNKEDLMKWIKSVSRTEDELFYVQPKYDGISCHFNYGVYATRGDGYVGEDITNVCIAMCKHETADIKNDYYGELVIKKSDFKNLYSNIFRPDGNIFKNSRNAVAGILGTDDYMYYANQGAIFTLIAYNKYSFDMKANEAHDKWDIIRGVINSLDYPMDGIVVKIADKEYAESLGYTSHHPKSAMAFKFENAQAETYLKGIEWGMGKENITATAIFEPINLNGVEVTRAYVPMQSQTLPCINNGDFREFSKITVERAGDVIPHITNIETNYLGVLFKIDKCPFCNSDIIVTNSAIKCSNPDCRRKKVHRLYDALVMLGVKNIGETTVDVICRKLIEKNGMEINLNSWMNSILKSNPFEFISRLDGFGEKSASIIIEETKMICNNTLPKFIASLGIPNVGIKIGTTLTDKFGDINHIIKANLCEYAGIEGVGKVMSERLHNYFKENGEYVLETAKHFIFEGTNPSSNSKSICFTGAMSYPRSQMSQFAKNAGYNVIDSVTKSLDILVVADNADLTSSKCVKAQKYGTNVITETEFFKLIKK